MAPRNPDEQQDAEDEDVDNQYLLRTAAPHSNGSDYDSIREKPTSDLELGGSSSTVVRFQHQPRRRRGGKRRHHLYYTKASSNETAGTAPTALSSPQQSFETDTGRSRRLLLAPTVSLPLLVLIDMFAVSLVVPLLFQYYKAAGVQRANQRELLSSIFSISQIVGGLMFGVLTDAKLLRRRTILLLSFAGSALSYAMIVVGGLYTLLLSRVLVGLVKQTMTVTTTMLTHHTNKENRAKHMGRLTASSTVAWIVGPSVGALLFKYVDSRAPALLACALFVANLILAAVLLDNEDDDDILSSEEGVDSDDDRPGSWPSEAESHDTNAIQQENGASRRSAVKGQASSALSSERASRGLSIVLYNLRSCFSSRALGAVVLTKLIMTWCTKATSYAQLGSFYEDLYGLEPHHRGYISSYQQLLRFVVNLALVGPILSWAGGERQATCYCIGGLAVAVYLESQQSLPLFLLLLCPVISLSFAISDLSIQTLVTHVAPASSIFSVLAALDVLQNAVSVSVPFYRTWLFRQLASDTAENAMQGDPDPTAWVRSSSLHWVVALFIMSYLLLFNESWWKPHERQQETSNPRKKGR